MKKAARATMGLAVMMIALSMATASAHVHVWPTAWVNRPGKAATCMREGWQEQRCKKAGCGAHRYRKVARVRHDYKAATCTEAKTCRFGCGTTVGSALGHVYKAATCIASKTCTRCQGTVGGLGSHHFSTATCTQKATCPVCGYTTGPLKPHHLVNGVCTMCGVTFVQ